MRYEPLFHSAGIVLLGKFNPAIVSPAWLARVGVFDTSIADAAELGVVHPQVAQFRAGGVSYLIEEERVNISVSEEPFIGLLDIVLLMFGKTLNHTPITAGAVNYAIHFAMPDTESRNKLGRALAPLGPWGSWGSSLPDADPTKNGGLASLKMRQMSAPHRDKGYRQVTLEGSARRDIVDPAVGVYMIVNDHVDVPEAELDQGAAFTTRWLRDNFETSINEARVIMSDLQDFAATL